MICTKHSSKMWIPMVTSSWILSSTLVVDTFFLLSGIFCIYSLPNEVSVTLFLKNLHVFYLHRLLRLLPLLATVVLFQTSIVNWLSDGPDWPKLAFTSEVCKQRWWAVLLHIQNYLKPSGLCLVHSWYLTVDTQLYMLSPLVLIFLFGSRKIAWSVMTLTLIASLITVTYYAFTYEIPVVFVNVWYLKIPVTYLRKFFAHTPARATPYVIGIMFGYTLKVHQEKPIKISKKYVVLLWLGALGTMAFCVFAPNETLHLNYYVPHFFDHFLSSYMRSTWAASVGWVILACTHGYGGPIDWFLSQPLWKLPSRMSYAAYLVHLPIMMVRNNGVVKSAFFSDIETIYNAASYIFISMLVAFALCVVIDAPCSTLQKAVLEPSRDTSNANGAKIQENH
ncbi:O-acyltransferase like protein-like [Leptidea sinapis]|uniref:O-acyltransferase like protein-like n=1 Tax=Leptidea sinapis TaxID=189913 RepID=UPI0021C382B0|nr:O-acyltransferase like protein-like [Leptidea sinapis]